MSLCVLYLTYLLGSLLWVKLDSLTIALDWVTVQREGFKCCCCFFVLFSEYFLLMIYICEIWLIKAFLVLQKYLPISFTLILFWWQTNNCRQKAKDKEQDMAAHKHLKGSSSTTKENSIKQKTAAGRQKEGKEEQGRWSHQSAWTNATATSKNWHWQKVQDDDEEEESWEGVESCQEGKPGQEMRSGLCAADCEVQWNSFGGYRRSPCRPPRALTQFSGPRFLLSCRGLI